MESLIKITEYVFSAFVRLDFYDIADSCIMWASSGRPQYICDDVFAFPLEEHMRP